MRHLVVLLLLFLLLASCHTHRRVLKKQAREKARYERKHPNRHKTTAEEYISAYKKIARQQMRRHGIPASITLAQGMLESANGNSDLALFAHNHFGIKCNGAWAGKSYFKDDDKKDECFRKYKKSKASFKDHSRFLQSSRYASLYSLGRKDYKGWAKGLKQAGYATNPKYPQLLINLIEKHRLYRFD
jgi:flagellum-specific peptidoglycan hydrolase FlgJ